LRRKNNLEDMDALSLLQEWYSTQCNGYWEHQWGVKIDTLDNPGWMLEIDLIETRAAQRALERNRIERSEHDWIEYWVESKKFKAAMGPRNLAEAVRIFHNWFESGANPGLDPAVK
jgi:hypothetical protein